MSTTKKIGIIVSVVALLSLIFLFLSTNMNSTKLMFIALGLTIIAFIGLSIQVILKLNKPK